MSEATDETPDETASRATVELLLVHGSPDRIEVEKDAGSETASPKEVAEVQAEPQACLGDGEQVADAVTLFLARTEPQIDVIRALARSRDAELVIRICWAPAGGYGGFDLEPSDVVRLSSLCDRFSFRFGGVDRAM